MFIKTEFYLLTEFFFEKKKIKQFLVCFFLDFRRKIFEILANYLGASLSELPCKCPDESFGKKFWRNFFSLFSYGELKKFGPLAKKLASFIKTAFYYSTGTIWGNKLTCFSFFWNLDGIFFQFWLITWGKSFGTALYVPRGAIWRKQMCLGKLIVCFLFSDF